MKCIAERNHNQTGFTQGYWINVLSLINHSIVVFLHTLLVSYQVSHGSQQIVKTQSSNGYFSLTDALAILET